MAMAMRVEQAQIGSGVTRDKPITTELVNLLNAAAHAAGVEKVVVTSGGQPGTSGKRIGSTRHDGGRAADLHLIRSGRKLTFSDDAAPATVRSFITECARLGAIGIGAGVAYMGNATIHIGYGQTSADNTRVVWGKDGKSANAPRWLKDACQMGWTGGVAVPVPPPRPAPTAPSPPPPDVEPSEPSRPATGFLAAFFAFLRRIFGGS